MFPGTPGLLGLGSAAANSASGTDTVAAVAATTNSFLSVRCSSFVDLPSGVQVNWTTVVLRTARHSNSAASACGGSSPVNHLRGCKGDHFDTAEISPGISESRWAPEATRFNYGRGL